MFSLEQIKAAHSKVKSGADFPAYIKEIKALGVKSYEAYVADGHIDYCGEEGYKIAAPAKYDLLRVADTCNAAQFAKALKAHQQGHTDYPRFCSDCAVNGIEQWTVRMDAMTCTYYDKAGNNVLEEVIPA
ncbi:DUF1398 domain-containing protein [Filimonas effusa]|uniref:DUF1398 domain-containing protein n=1 Tax=Filimonas effusa TaxID=2508721 RepID=A0A4Q1DCM3_9BACT|nr:DUF1398 family protein [Filimonas effusa]RXK87274.1 DUF1398 domain-containing protein [Filimonas effusa]